MARREKSYSPRRKSYYSEDDDYDYSDSFVSDEEPERKHTTGRGRKVSKVGHKPPKGRGRGPNRTQSNPPKLDAVVQRVLSAKKLKIDELRNQVEELHTALKDVKEENKLLKKMQHRQEKALHKFDDKESDLPQIMQRHNNEVRTLREQLRKTKDKYDKNDRYLRDAEDELDRVKNKLTKYKKLADEEQLQERDELTRKLKQMELDVEEKESRVKDLEKHITHLNKNHRHEIGIEIARNREAQRNLEKLKEENEKIERILKEKEKELEIKNIYSNRVVGGRRFPNSYSGTPHDTPPPKPRRRAPSLHDLTPREKMKIYEEKRRLEDKKKQEPRSKNEAAIKPAFQFSDQSKEYSTRAKTREKAESKPRTIRHDPTSNKENDNQSNKPQGVFAKPNFGIGKGSNKKSNQSSYDTKYNDYGGSKSKNKNTTKDFESYDDAKKYDGDNFDFGGYNPSGGSIFGNKEHGSHRKEKQNSYDRKYDDFNFGGKPEHKKSPYTKDYEPKSKSKFNSSKNYVKWNSSFQDDIVTKKTSSNTFSFKAKNSYDERSVESDSLNNDSYSYSDDYTSSEEYGHKRNGSPKRSKAQERARKDREAKERDSFLQFEQDEADRRDRELREENDRDERERLEFERNEQKRKEEEDWRRSMDRKREEKEREDREREEREREQFRIERERKDREEREWREKMEREKREDEERKNRELREKHERERQDRERRDREREEQERRAREEKARYEDAEAEEARKKKDLLLAKLKQLDDNPEAKPDAFGVVTHTNTSVDKSKRKEKPDDLFFITSTNRGDSASTTSSKKSYKFGKPIENLHHGKPSHEDVSIPYLEKQKKKKEKEEAELIGSYQPSFVTADTKTTTANKPKPTGGIVFNEDFGGRTTKKRDAKKSNLMADLFGDSAQKNKNNDSDDIFSKTSKTTTATSNNNKRSTNSFPLDDDSKPTTTKINTTKRENSSTLFGGGSALIEDDFGGSNDTSKLLPKRHRQTNSTTFQSRPAVVATDHYDDDIEEVIL